MNKLKEVVRSRSRSRHGASKSLDSAGGHSYGDHEPRSSIEGGALSTPERMGTNTGVDDATARMRWLEIHGDEQGEDSKALPPLPANANERIAEASDNDASPNSPHGVPPRKSSMPRKPIPTPQERREGILGHKTNKSLDIAQNDPSPLVSRDSAQPGRGQGLHQQATPTSGANYSSSYDANEPSLNSDQILGSIPGYQRREYSPDRDRAGASGRQQTSAQTGATSSQPFLSSTTDRTLPVRSTNLDEHSTSGHNYSTSTSSSRQGTPVEVPEHVRLPPGFNIGNSSTTHVDTKWDRAVTHHTIRRERTEQVYEPIERHIHVNHHYHYVQPVTVQEILPPKHYQLDEKTGRKVEIPAPEGWVLPAEMKAQTEAKAREIRQLEASLKPTTRHYVVDEAHPAGQIENPSERHEQEEMAGLKDNATSGV